MAHRPEERYQAAADLTRDLERYLADEPVSAYREPRPVRLGRWARRHRTAVASGGVALLLVVAGVIAGLLLWQRAEERRRQQQLDYEQAQREEEQRQQQRDQERLLALKSSAKAAEDFAAAERGVGRFDSAARILRQAVQDLRDEPQLADERARLEAQGDRLHRLAEFFRLADQAESRLAESKGDEALAACKSALNRLGVFDHPEQWWSHLPAEDLTAEQLKQLQREACRALMVLGVTRLQRGLQRGLLPFGSSSREDYSSALEAVPLIQEFHRSEYHRESHAAGLLEGACRLKLGQHDQLKKMPAPDPASPADYFVVGVAHLWLAKAEVFGLPRWLVVGDLRKVGGFDFDSPAVTAERLLRTAAALEPKHYWTLWWLGSSLLLAEDYQGSEQVFNTCVALRPAEAFGYQGRAASLLKQCIQLEEAKPRHELLYALGFAALPCAPDPSFPLRVGVLEGAHSFRRAQGERRQNELLERALPGLDLALEHVPYDPIIHWHRGLCLNLRRQWAEALKSHARAVELEPPRRGLDGRRLAGDQPLGEEVCNLLRWWTKSNPNDQEIWSVFALALLALDKDDEAAEAADHTLKADARHPRALAVRGSVRLKRQKLQEALTDLQAAAEQNPKTYLAVGGRARAYEMLDRPAEALAGFDDLLGIAVTDWQRLEAHLGRARVLARLGRGEEARQALDQARTIDDKAAEAAASQLFR
jgi:tetratricopeptide (TPR) repeat protein